ncbi:MAG: NAD(P)/FAD-dependent oxidoreductase [Candidatus Acidiferrum sp.]
MRAPDSRDVEHSTPPAPRTRTAIIIGAGPAGLTAAYELLTRTDIKPIVLERTDYMGGISRTVNYKGNRIDIGGHRFFSKRDRVMNWWLSRMPLQKESPGSQQINYHGMTREIAVPETSRPADDDRLERVMLVRRRKSRIYFRRKFFDYPISLTTDTIRKLGFLVTVRAGLSYLRSLLFPIKDVKDLEQFFTNRFGRVLYRMFFKSYTEKVWGVPCNEISAEWGKQRIKGLSIRKSITHFIRQKFRKPSDIAQKSTETSLIEQFLYPKLGPGQMWECVAEEVMKMGGEILTECNVESIRLAGNRVASISAVDKTGSARTFTGDFFFSTMAVKELIQAMESNVPEHVREISDGLLYRDFITVGLLARKMTVSGQNSNSIDDNWIYIQDPDVIAGRLQIFNNWSPYMVADPECVWIGVEYFCHESDNLWNKSDAEMSRFASDELEKIGILRSADVIDSIVIRMPKTYPAYFGTYDRFHEVRQFVDGFENLFLIGRNGMHRYNNQDHSMLTAMMAVDNIAAGITDKSNLWKVNTEMEYLETGDQDAGASAHHRNAERKEGDGRPNASSDARV